MRLSRIDLLLLATLAVVVGAVAVPMLARTRRAGDPIADANDLAAIHKACTLHADAHGGEWPRPSVAMAASGTPERALDHTLDTTANTLSLLLAGRGVAAAQLVSRSERNPIVRALEYDFARVNAANQTLWDPGFKTELDKPPGEGVCHTSYAHLALCGERLSRWRSSAGAETPLVGDRGTWRGTRRGKLWAKSYTLGRHGQPEAVWAGNLTFGDGHVALLTSFTPDGVRWGCGTIAPRKDNLFDCEFNQLDCTNALLDGRAAGDAWLCIADRMEGPNDFAVDVKERLVDGTAPR